jgi:hypothetical protein
MLASIFRGPFTRRVTMGIYFNEWFVSVSCKEEDRDRKYQAFKPFKRLGKMIEAPLDIGCLGSSYAALAVGKILSAVSGEDILELEVHWEPEKVAQIAADPRWSDRTALKAALTGEMSKNWRSPLEEPGILLDVAKAVIRTCAAGGFGISFFWSEVKYS